MLTTQKLEYWVVYWRSYPKVQLESEDSTIQDEQDDHMSSSKQLILYVIYTTFSMSVTDISCSLYEFTVKLFKQMSTQNKYFFYSFF